MAQMPLDPDHYYRQNLELSGEYIGIMFKDTGLIPAPIVQDCEERIDALKQMGYHVDESTWPEFWRARAQQSRIVRLHSVQLPSNSPFSERMCHTERRHPSMMNRSQSWIEPQLNWTVSPATIACVAPAHSQDLVELLANGKFSPTADDKELASGLSALLGYSIEAACYKHVARTDASSNGRPEHFFLHAIFELPNSDFLVLLGPDPSPDACRPERIALQQRAADRLQRYRDDVEAEARQREARRLEITNDPALPAEVKKISLTMLDCGLDEPKTPRPPHVSDLSLSAERVTLAHPLPDSLKERRDAILAALIASGRPPARNGMYHCVEVPFEDQTQAAFIRWTPRGATTPALEVKAALERCSKSVFANPRSRDRIPPQPESSIVTQLVSRGELRDATEMPNVAVLSDFLPRPSAEGKASFARDGFEAIGWYQPFHRYDNSVWGIHFDANNLDEFVANLAQDLGRTESRGYELAAYLGIWLTAAHELFHARIEFASAWIELSMRRSRFLAYSDAVYMACRFTPNWLEEALANWSADSWLRHHLDELCRGGLVQNPAAVLAIVEDWLDFSPEGYNRWRDGDSEQSWDKLATELAIAVPSVKRRMPAPPINGILRGDSLFDLHPEDVPVYFVGNGVVADACFSAPARREVLRVLNHCGYVLLAGRGRGSHELWQGPTGKTFTLPSRDPLSPGVFHSLLHHFGWSKQQYMQQIRTI